MSTKTATTPTSPVSNKVVHLYNLHFFKAALSWMSANNTDTAIDASGTVWHKQDVQEILSSSNLQS